MTTRRARRARVALAPTWRPSNKTVVPWWRRRAFARTCAWEAFAACTILPRGTSNVLYVYMSDLALPEDDPSRHVKLVLPAVLGALIVLVLLVGWAQRSYQKSNDSTDPKDEVKGKDEESATPSSTISED